MSERIHIIVVEPSAIIRMGLSSILQQSETLNIDIAEVYSISEIASVLHRQIPDVVIISPSHLGALPIEQLRAEAQNDKLKVVALQSSFMEQSSMKNFDEVISIYDPLEVIQDKLTKVTSDEQIDPNKKELSAREKEIIVCVVKGMINKQIADELCISTHTVVTHRKNIANKLQIHSPSGLTIYAIVNNLVDLADVKNTISQPKDTSQ
ncbi:MAG: LuxR C-terminal-related transcriptional regulator [Rikenellaceae bacterium]